MIERLEKLRDSLPRETVIGADLTRGENPYKGGEEDCLVVTFRSESAYVEQAEVIMEINRQGFAIDDFFGYLVVFER